MGRVEGGHVHVEDVRRTEVGHASAKLKTFCRSAADLCEKSEKKEY